MFLIPPVSFRILGKAWRGSVKAWRGKAWILQERRSAMSEKNREQSLRRALNNAGYSLKKSRRQYVSIDNFCGYMIINDCNNTVAAGSRFELSLDDVADFITE